MPAPETTEALRIAPLTVSDAPEINALHCRNYPIPWSEADYRQFAEADYIFGLVARWQDEIAGVIVTSIVVDEGMIIMLAVDHLHRRRGIASRLMHRTLERLAARGATRLFLEVSTGNEAACSLYNRLGFIVVGHRPHYYNMPEGPQDALVMRLPEDAASWRQIRSQSAENAGGTGSFLDIPAESAYRNAKP